MFAVLKKALLHGLFHRKVIVLQPPCPSCVRELDRFSWKTK